MVNERLISERARREKATHSLPSAARAALEHFERHYRNRGWPFGALVLDDFRREIIGAVGKLGVTVPVHSVDVIR